MKRKRKLQKERDRHSQMVNRIAKILLNSAYGKLVYADTDSIEVTPEEANYVTQDNIIIQDFFKKQEV